MAETEVLALNKPSLTQMADEGSGANPNVTTPPAPTGSQVLDMQQRQGSVITQEPRVGGSTATATPVPLGENYYATTAPLTASWETNAQRQAGIKFKQDALAGKQTMIKSAGELQAEGQAGQTELALGEYKRGQSAEKAGWTGGYMLDQKRQGDYLRASIQAQMYGAQELQKYGMDTQLEAARLAYDMGKDQLAYQMYQEAQQLALTEAGMFGYYVSPEIKDMMNQLAAAQNVLLDSPEDERALAVKGQIEDWFGREGIDPQDLSTFGKLTMEREQYNQAKLDAMLASVGDDPSVFLARNTNGTYATDPATGQYIKLNFEDITKDDLFAFLGKDNNAEYKFADTAFKSYARYLGQSTINSYFTSLEEGEAPTSEGFQEYLNEEGNDRITAYIESLGLEKGSTEYNQVETLLTENFNPTLTRDGVSISYSFGERANGTNPSGASTTPEDPNNPFSTTYDYKETPEKVMDNYKTVYQDYWKVNGKNELTFDKMVSEYKFLYGQNYFKNTTDYAVKFEEDLNTYYKVVNGKYNLSMNDNDFKSIDNMAQALTIIKQDGFMDTKDIYRDLLTQGIKSKIGLDLTGKIQVHNEEVANLSGARNRGFKVKLTDLSETQKANLLSTIKAPYSERDGFLIIRTQGTFGNIDNANTKVSVGKNSDAYAYRTILFNMLKAG